MSPRITAAPPRPALEAPSSPSPTVGTTSAATKLEARGSTDSQLSALPAHYGASAAQIQAFVASQSRPAAGGRGDGFGPLSTPELEAKVAARADLTQPLPLVGTTETQRAAQLGRLVQIDGRQGTAIDGVSCGPMCLVAGLYLRDPEGLMKTAGFVLNEFRKLPTKDQSPGALEMCAAVLNLPAAKLQESLESIRRGKPTPQSLATLAQVLIYEAAMRMDGATNILCKTTVTEVGKGRAEALKSCNKNPPSLIDPLQDGSRSVDLQNLVSQFVVHGAGVKAPSMQLELRMVDTEKVVEREVFVDGKKITQLETKIVPQGHWVAEFKLLATNRETGAKTPYLVTYDPWPNATGGRADINMVDKHDDIERRGLHRGRPSEEHRVPASGQIQRVRG